MKKYFKDGKIKMEITFQNGKAIQGSKYVEYGTKKELTHAHFNNMGFEY